MVLVEHCGISGQPVGMPRRALIIGINAYGSNQALQAAVADAQAVGKLLSRHKDAEKNFDCFVWADQTTSGEAITRHPVKRSLVRCFDRL